MTGDDKRSILAEVDPEIITADGFDDALIGTAFVGGGAGLQVACYDYNLCVDVLLAEGMELDDAIEHMNFNVTGGYVGIHTPIFLCRFTPVPE